MDKFTFFLDIKWLVFVFTGTTGLTLISFSLTEIKNGFKYALNGTLEGQNKIRLSLKLWESAARNAYIFGILGSLIHLILLIGNINQIKGLSHISLILAQSFQTGMYGLVLATVFFTFFLKTQKKMKDLSAPIKRLHFNKKSVWELITGYTLMVLSFFLIFIKSLNPQFIFHLPTFLIIFGGSALIYLFAGNKTSFSLIITALGFISIFLGLSKIFYSFYTPHGIAGIAQGMMTILISLFYVLLGIIFLGIPQEDKIIKEEEKPLILNRVIWYSLPVISIGIFFILFFIMITPISKK